MKNEYRKIILWALVICAVIITATGLLFFGVDIQERLNRRNFDPIEWQSQESFTNDIRIKMVDDLLRRHTFKGMTRKQVVSIIGEPDKTEYFKEWDLVYWLGPERGFFGIDSEWLVFKMDNHKKITVVAIVRD
jgi:hypothetical protein